MVDERRDRPEHQVNSTHGVTGGYYDGIRGMKAEWSKRNFLFFEAAMHALRV